MEEPVSNLVSPPNATPFVPSMKYTFSGSSAVATTITSTPLLCADTAAPSSQGTALNPVFYTANGLGSATPRPFVFGASAGSPDVSTQATGATGVKMSTTSMRFTGDALGSLVCYGLDSNGVRRVTRDVFMEEFDGNAYNSTVTLSVFHLPSSTSDYYGYKVDVTLPPLSGSSDNFALVEGFDSAVFATGVGDSIAGQQGTWCQSFDGSSCAFAPNAGNINFSYFNGVNTSLQAPVAPNGTVQYHFIVKRYLHTGVTLPLPATPLAIAALFSPADLQENKLDDNVSAGTNQVANAAPVVLQDATLSSFSSSLAALQENTDSGSLTFNIGDTDTAETSGPPLSAAVTLTVAGLSMPVTADCSTLLNISNGNLVNRACHVDIPLNNGSWWNASVGSAYAGAFNAVATDTTNGVYAFGVTATAKIIATDSLGKASSPVSIPVHINSTANNNPTLTYGGALANAVDPNNSQTYPTFSCSVGLGSAAGGCGAANRGSIEVDLVGVASAAGGPPAAFDELAYQTTAIVPFSDPNDSFTNVQCTREQQAALFVTNGGPIFTPGSGGQYDVNFLLPTTPPASAVSALCTLTIADVGPFPNGQQAKTTAKTFRVVVSP